MNEVHMYHRRGQRSLERFILLLPNEEGRRLRLFKAGRRARRRGMKSHRRRQARRATTQAEIIQLLSPSTSPLMCIVGG